MAKIATVVHGGCPDGFGAAYASWLFHKERSNYYFCVHGQEPPDLPLEVEKVYIFDFSFPRDVILDWKDRYDLTLIDHHVSAQRKLGDIPGCHFDLEQSGAVLAFKHLFPKAEVPDLLNYVQDQDLWRHKLNLTEEVNYWISSFDQDFMVWNNLACDFAILGLNEIAKRGAEIKRYVNQQIARAMSDTKIRMMRISGYDNIPVVNTQTWMSEIGNRLCQIYPAPFAATYFDRADDVRQWSFRSIGDFDVSQIATELGGGGHKNAAGAEESLVDKFVGSIGN